MGNWMASVPGILDAVGNVAGFFQGKSDNKKQREFAQRQFQFQMDAAKQGVQWRAADARAAGIHPLAALGMMPSSFSPVSMGQESTGAYLSNMGQDIGRAVGAYQSSAERRKQLAGAAHEAIIARKRDEVLFDQTVRANELDIQMKNSQLARLNSPGSPPPLESAAPGSVNVVPDRVTVGSVGEPARAPGMVTDFQLGPTASGGFAIIPSQDMKQRIEDMPSEWQWFLRNGITPPRQVYDTLNRLHPPPHGQRWQFDAMRGEFRLQGTGDPLANLYQFFFRPDLYRR